MKIHLGKTCSGEFLADNTVEINTSQEYRYTKNKLQMLSKSCQPKYGLKPGMLCACAVAEV